MNIEYNLIFKVPSQSSGHLCETISISMRSTHSKIGKEWRKHQFERNGGLY